MLASGGSNISDPNEFATPESFAAAMKMSKYFKVNLDIGHFTAANYDALAYMREHHADITNLHLKDRGIGVLISDHNVEQTLDIVDRAYIMFDGKVQVSGTVRELVFDDTVAERYLGPTLSARLRARFERETQGEGA